MANNRGTLYARLIGGQSLNIADILNSDSNNESVNRIIVDVDTTNGLATTINLPEISSLPFPNLEILVGDSKGNASAGNITINRGGTTDKINGGTSQVINTNFAKATFSVASVPASGSTIPASWASYNQSAIIPPSQTSENGVTDGANTFTLANVPLATQHLIVFAGGRAITPTSGYTLLGKTITFLAPVAPGDPVLIFYSF